MGNDLVKQKNNAIQALASKLEVSPENLTAMLKKTAFKDCRTNEEFLSAVIVANTYRLNPILKEMYAFPAKGGGITPIVSIDGWISLVNRQPGFDGCELIENFDGNNLVSVTATFHLKHRSHPVVVTEYMDECCNSSKEPWKKWPKRMLRHKAYIQGARIAFGFSGIYDPDEAERIDEGQIIEANVVEMPKAKIENKPAAQVVPQESQEQEPIQEETKAENSYVDMCSSCQVGITQKVFDFSMKKFGKQLCYSCQQEQK